MKPSLAKDLETENPKKLAAIKKVHGIVDKPVVIVVAEPLTEKAKPKQHRFPSIRKPKTYDVEMKESEKE